MKHATFFLSAILASISLLNGQTISSITDDNEYPLFCYSAAQDPELFANFKRIPVYAGVVENVSYEFGRQCLQIIRKQTPELLKNIDKFKTNDLLGNPKTYFYHGVGNISPTTLRYIKVASDLILLHGSLDNFSIIEIGGGYGGQCKILSDLFDIKKYIIIDLPGPLALIERYLKEQNIENVTLINAGEAIVQENYDLVLSNYAFSECVFDVQKFYIQNVFVNCKKGYLTCNVPNLYLPTGYLFASKEDTLKELSLSNILWREYKERPLTHPFNYILCW